MTTMAQENDTRTVGVGPGSLPVDTESIRDGLIHALTLPLATTTREDINASIRHVRGHLNLLMGEELGYDSDPAVRDLFSRAYALLDLGRRPSEETPVFEAFAYLRDTARVAQRLLDIFGEFRRTLNHRPGIRLHPGNS
ncbi:hypothetical protein [Streptomyces sp. BE230]|uniref:hypothetical protein n=1 Tax=Streptomyces sp. BE230 TaxID=3002526 RepID=UPI002ED4F985|nr:hypothetical protein [Streptomyces sp. BE230]